MIYNKYINVNVFDLFINALVKEIILKVKNMYNLLLFIYFLLFRSISSAIYFILSAHI